MTIRKYDYLIRPFEPSDQEAARRLILQGLSEHFGTINESLNADLNDIMSNYMVPGRIFFVVVNERRIVGTGALITEDIGIGRIMRVSVDREYRQQGSGKAIVEHLLDIARQRGCTRVVVETNNDWHDAIGLYQCMGFIEYDRDATSVFMVFDVHSQDREET